MSEISDTESLQRPIFQTFCREHRPETALIEATTETISTVWQPRTSTFAWRSAGSRITVTTDCLAATTAATLGLADLTFATKLPPVRCLFFFTGPILHYHHWRRLSLSLSPMASKRGNNGTGQALHNASFQKSASPQYSDVAQTERIVVKHTKSGMGPLSWDSVCIPLYVCIYRLLWQYVNCQWTVNWAGLQSYFGHACGALSPWGQ